MIFDPTNRVFMIHLRFHQARLCVASLKRVANKHLRNAEKRGLMPSKNEIRSFGSMIETTRIVVQQLREELNA